MIIELKYKSASVLSLILSIGFHLLMIALIIYLNIIIKNKTDISPVFTEIFTEEKSITNRTPVYSSIAKAPEGINTSDLGFGENNSNKPGTQDLIQNRVDNAGGSGVSARANIPSQPGSDIITANGNSDGLNVNSGSGNGSGTGLGTGTGVGTYGTANAGGSSLSKLPFIPRQIIEALPKKIESAEGEISIHLKINTDGTVKEYKIVRNTSNHPECLNSVVAALHKSKWEAVTYKGSKVEYWIEKTYTFSK